MLPFEYKGKTYTNCTDTEHTELWCITDTENKWGNCKGTCGKLNGASLPCKILCFSYRHILLLTITFVCNIRLNNSPERFTK